MAEAIKKRIPLGSGEIYIDEYTGTIPTNELLETEAKKLGEILGGAVLEYKQSFYTAKSDNGKVTKTVLTDEEANLKAGICTIDSKKTYGHLSSTVSVTEDATKKTRTVKIGGISKDNGKVYVIRFVQKDAIDGDLRVTIVGKNVDGFTLDFKKDKETVINPNFKAEPNDAEGTLIIIEEAIA